MAPPHTAGSDHPCCHDSVAIDVTFTIDQFLAAAMSPTLEMLILGSSKPPPTVLYSGRSLAADESNLSDHRYNTTGYYPGHTHGHDRCHGGCRGPSDYRWAGSHGYSRYR